MRQVPVKWNIPNIITVFRVFLVPVFVALLEYGMDDAAFIVFIIAGISDGLDGYIARRFDMRTEFGRMMDPIADKLLMTAAFIMLSLKGLLPVYLCVLVISRDLMILTGYIGIKSAGKKIEIIPSVFGKLSTIFQLSAVVAALWEPVRTSAYMPIIIYLTTAITIISGMHYAYVGFLAHRRG
ncbi:MAG: CDP-diacylglycerol--glycerol-3-phosphate 3-phosphatidyltransferase [Deltaproteobacteria bacterium]|nr:CDP-diacylglycerol--glycerol-3-phosphate 3-phosphatidyltransferase [Deltaproteobacteria bacterium]